MSTAAIGAVKPSYDRPIVDSALEFKEKKAEESAVSSPAASSHVLDPSIVAKDGERRKEIEGAIAAVPSRKPFMQTIFNVKIHTAIVDAQKPFLENPAVYGRYLLSLQHDVDLIEAALQKSSPKLACLPLLLRSEALKLDIKALKAEGSISKLIKEKNHEDHFKAIADKPHLLIVHASVHYLGFLFGGQGIAKMVSTWEGSPSNLYKFDQSPDKLTVQFLDEMDLLIRSLSQDEYAAFQKEVVIAWQFACDILEKDIRSIV